MRTFIPVVLLGLIMSVIYVMPPFRRVDSALDLKLGESLGAWTVRIEPVQEKVRQILANDTDIVNGICVLPRVEEQSSITFSAPVDYAHLSLILSGDDLANSIHRPERCLVAQGHRGLVVNKDRIVTDDERIIPVARILSKQDLGYGPKDDRKILTRHCITYYFFVGHDRTTASHTERTLIDIADRVFKGESQRWAFVMCTMPYLPDLDHEFGGPPDFQMADTKIRQLLAEVADQNIDWSRINP